MRAHRPIWGWLGSRFASVMLLAVSAALIALVYEGSRSHVVAENPSQLEATIFSFDGKDFVRTKTTLMDEQGKSAVGTKLDHNSLAYKALMKKHSYSGPSTVFGKKYEADYAPLMGADGKVTGALFIGEAK